VVRRSVVVWVQHRSDDLPVDSDAWRYVPQLVRRDSEPLVHKEYGDSFEGIDLESVLAERGIGRLVVCGAQTDECTNLYWTYQAAPGRTAGTVSTADVDFAASSA
jgi:nicotinamidase-related amidase